MPVINKNNEIRIYLFVDACTYRKFKKISKEDGRTMSNALRVMIRNYIAEYEQNKDDLRPK